MSGRRGTPVHVLHVVPGLGPGGMELAMARVITGLTGGEINIYQAQRGREAIGPFVCLTRLRRGHAKLTL